MSITRTCDIALETQEVLLKNGKGVLIRPVCRNDEQLEKDLFEGLSPESRRDRFLGGSHKVTAKLLELLTDNDHVQHEAVIALAKVDSATKAVGVAHYALDEDGHGCECALVIDDDWQNQGLGTRLLQRLIDTARARGIDRIYSIDSAQNHRFDHMARAMGFECKADPHDYTLLTYSLDLKPETKVARAA